MEKEIINITTEAFKSYYQFILKENIDASEAYDNEDSIQTVIDKKRNVGLVDLSPNDILDLQEKGINIMPVFPEDSDIRNQYHSSMSKSWGDNGAKKWADKIHIIYNDEGSNDANKLYDYMKSKGGFVSDDTPEEAKYIGKLLGYDDKSIEGYINKRYFMEEEIRQIVREAFEQILSERRGKKKRSKKKKADRCIKIAKRKYNKWPSAYASGSVVQCRAGKIWRDLKGESVEYFGNINEVYNEWARPMYLKEDSMVSEALKYHLDNEISLSECAFRYGSEEYFNLVSEVQHLYENDVLDLNENDEFIISEHDDDFCVLGGERVKLNFIFEEVEDEPLLSEAEYQGKNVEVGKPKRGGSKKFYVYVRNPKTGKIKKVSFGAKDGGGNLSVKLKDPKARKRFADRHNCEQKNDRTTPGYWSCRLPRYAKQLGLSGGGRFW